MNLHAIRTHRHTRPIKQKRLTHICDDAKTIINLIDENLWNNEHKRTVNHDPIFNQYQITGDRRLKHCLHQALLIIIIKYFFASNKMEIYSIC